MRAVGIVAEYNPFHKGHEYQIRRIREMFGDNTPVVVALSGDFVQRGGAAVFSKFARAEAAVRCGVSLVLELPLPWCMSSAEAFARGGIGLLQAAGVVDSVCFGSECGDTEPLRRCAGILDSPEYSQILRDELKKGLSFAAARENSVRALAGDLGTILGFPNDILGVEYFRAAESMGFNVDFVTIARNGTAHDAPGSASDLRCRMEEGAHWMEDIPPEAAAVFAREIREGRGPVLPEDLRIPLVSRLRACAKKDFASVPDGGEGLENLLYDASRSENSPEEMAMAAKSKRYALSRLRRMIYSAALGICEDMTREIPPYIRVLALDEKGAELLREMKNAAKLPILTKPAHIRRLGETAQDIFALGSGAHDLYVLGYRDMAQQTGGGDYRTGPYIHPSKGENQ